MASEDHHGESFFDDSAKHWDDKPGVQETADNVFRHLKQALAEAG